MTDLANLDRRRHSDHAAAAKIFGKVRPWRERIHAEGPLWREDQTRGKLPHAATHKTKTNGDRFARPDTDQADQRPKSEPGKKTGTQIQCNSKNKNERHITYEMQNPNLSIEFQTRFNYNYKVHRPRSLF
jgi:hypothetical protein